jgi:hypothetical protein
MGICFRYTSRRERLRGARKLVITIAPGRGARSAGLAHAARRRSAVRYGCK